jgi:hypothetical protein
MPPKIVRRMTNAYVRLATELVPPSVELAITRALNDGLPEEAFKSIPFYDPLNPEIVAIWSGWADGLKDAMMDALTGSANKELDALGLPLRVEVQKAKAKPKAARKKPRPSVPVLPVRPGSVLWATKRSSTLISKVSLSQTKTVRAILTSAVKSGARGPDTARRISACVGLLDREADAVVRFHARMLNEGVDQERAKKASDKYAAQLLRKRGERIARSEIIAAMAEGQRTGWIQAQEEGLLPLDVKRKWVAAPGSDNPDRPCQICTDLADMPAVGLDEPWIYDDREIWRAGGGDGGAHVECRCGSSLERGEN